MNEESFVDLLDNSTINIEQRRISNIYQGLRPASKPASREREIVERSLSAHKRGPPVGHREETNVDTYESEYM